MLATVGIPSPHCRNPRQAKAMILEHPLEFDGLILETRVMCNHSPLSNRQFTTVESMN
jgi:hypothetical protein